MMKLLRLIGALMLIAGMALLAAVCYTEFDPEGAQKRLLEGYEIISETAEDTAGALKDWFAELSTQTQPVSEENTETEEGTETVLLSAQERSTEFDGEYCIYYSFLTREEQEVYRQIYEAVRDSAEEIRLETGVDCDALSEAFEAVCFDHPELFWLDTTAYGYSVTDDGICTSVKLHFLFEGESLELAKARFNAVSEEIISAASACSTDDEKERYVHDAILSLASYSEEAEYNQSAYSALVGCSTVCAGYSRAFQYIMNELGVPTYFCIGNSGTHAWNIVKLGDGYYNVDLTADQSERYGIIHYFFNGTDRDFSETHGRCGASLKLPACNATEYRHFGEGFTAGTAPSDAHLGTGPQGPVSSGEQPASGSMQPDGQNGRPGGGRDGGDRGGQNGMTRP